MTGKANISLEDLLTPDDLCKLLKVEMSWVYRAVRQREIPFVKLGKYLRFHRPSVEKWLAESQVNR